jgi:hypothetical protein
MIASITTKYSGPTDRSGSRIVAKAMFAAGRTGTPDSKRTTKAWDHSLSNEENHRQAAFKALAAGGLIRGDYDLTGFRSDDGTGYWCAVAKDQPAPRMPNVAGRNDKLDDLLFNIGHSAGILGNYPENYLTPSELESDDGKVLLVKAGKVREICDWMVCYKRSMRPGKEVVS